MRDPIQELSALSQANLLRQLREFQSPQGPTLRTAEYELINFASNDYLGLSQNPDLAEIMAKAAQDWGVGSGSSRLVSGTLAPHRDLEDFIAAFKSTEAALTFTSGYAASVGTLSALMQTDDWIILDKLAHASLVDGARLSGAKIRVFPHNSIEMLERLLIKARQKAAPHARILIVTESVFSMDGDLSPLEEIIALKEKYGAWLLLDEAHSIGVLGPQGKGLAASLGHQHHIELQLGTFSKAAGCCGAYLACTRALQELLINRARSFIYSTAPPPSLAVVALNAMHFLSGPLGDLRRTELWKILTHVQEALCLPQIESAIVPILLGSADKALTHSQTLLQFGILAPAIRFPTVPKNQARLRLSFTALHTDAHIASLKHAMCSITSLVS